MCVCERDRERERERDNINVFNSLVSDASHSVVLTKDNFFFFFKRTKIQWCLELE